MPIDPIIHPRQLLDYYNYMYLVALHGSLEKKRIVGQETALTTLSVVFCQPLKFLRKKIVWRIVKSNYSHYGNFITLLMTCIYYKMCKSEMDRNSYLIISLCMLYGAVH